MAKSARVRRRLAAPGRELRLGLENDRLRRERDHLQAEAWRYAKLYDAAPVACFTLDATGIIVEANQTAARMLGISREALVGANLARRVMAGHRTAFAAHLAETISGGVKRSCQLAFEPAGGAAGFVGHLDSVAVQGPLGQTLCLTALSAAMERGPQERALAEHLHQERKLHEAVEAAGNRFDRIAMVAAMLAESLDLDQAAARAAAVAVPELASFCAIDLCDAEGRVHRAAMACDAGSPGDLPLDPYAPHGSAVVVRTGRPTILRVPSSADILALTTDPANLPTLWGRVGSYLCLPLRSGSRTLGAMVFIRSHRPAYTAEDVALAEEIARHTALVIDNARLYREAQEMDRRKDEFLAMLAHELRNPLAAIVLAGTLLQANGKADLGTRRAGDVIRRQSERLTRLVDDLLDVSRITHGKLTLRPQRVVLGDVIARAVESVRPLLQERRHELAITQPEEPIALQADQPRLEQVLVNLLANAARYTEPGGHITLAVAREGDEAVVRVRDTGIGIAPEMLARVFAPFTRVTADLDRGDRGLGIGLTLARALIELHGGHLYGHSKGLGHGSEFVVRLPAPVIKEAPAPARTEAPLPAPPRRRVLLVEDERDVADMMRARLEALGQEVTVAHDGTEAVAAALDGHPELLLIDVCLPGMSGYEVAQELRRAGALAGATFIALTGFGDEEARRRSLEAGFDRHFTKPIGEEALLGLLRGA